MRPSAEPAASFPAARVPFSPIRLRLIVPTLLVLLIPAASVAGQAPSQRYGDLRSRLPAGLGPATACATADLDLDGRADLIRAAGAVVTVLLQDALGRFAPLPGQIPLVFPSSGDVVAIAVGRFDSDADLDVVVGLSAGPDILLVNDGRGAFRPASPSPLPTAPLATQDLVVADFDGRNGDDLLLLASNTTPILLMSDGLAVPSFTDQSTLLPADVRGTRSSAAAADFDRDGAVDLAFGGANVAVPVVLFNSGRGDFRTGVVQLLPATVSVHRLRAHDMTGDGFPDVVIGTSASGQRAPILIAYAGNRGFSLVPSSGFVFDALQDLAITDVNGDTVGDLLVVQGNGEILLGMNDGTGRFPRTRALVEPAPRCCLCAADLDGDGDPDVYVPGRNIDDAMLIGRGDGLFLDTESATLPAGVVAGGQVLAVVDATGDGDPDLVVLDPDGAASQVWVQDGGVRFVPGAPGLVPQLPAGSAFRQVEVGSIAGSGRDLIVLGQPTTGNLQGLRLLVWNGGAWRDETALRFPIDLSAQLLTSLAVGQFGPRQPLAPIEIVLGDGNGQMRLFRASAGVYAEVARAFPATGVASLRQILIGDANADGLADVVALPSLGGPRLFQALNATSFAWRSSAITLGATATTGEFADVDGDGLGDLLLVTPATAQGFAFLRNHGGVFVDETALWFGTIQVAGAVTVEVFGPPSARSIAFGRDLDADLVVQRRGAAFGPLEVLAVRGSERTRRIVAADLDLDGDVDVVTLRDGSRPAVSFDLTLQLAQIGATKVGTTGHFLVRGRPGRAAFVFFSPFTARVPIPSYGILRLVNPVTVFTGVLPAHGELEFALPIPASLPPRFVPFQAAVVDFAANALEIGNLERMQLTDF